jgi:exopolysaccharide biosynthesis polyprenyl glycosylphosphotransferase
MVLAMLRDVYDLGVAANPRATFSALLTVALLEIGGYLAFYFFSPRQALPRGIVLFHAALALGLVVAWRTLYATGGRTALRRRVIIAGTGIEGRAMAATIAGAEGIGLEVVGFVSEGNASWIGHGGLPVLETYGGLPRLVDELSIAQVILAVSGKVPHTLFAALLECNEQGVEVTPMTAAFEEITGRVPIEHVGDNWLLALPLGPPSTAGLFPMLKRALDVGVATVGLGMLALLFPVVAAAIYVDSGAPIFYVQERVGRGGDPFRLIKFRTMRQDAEYDGQAVWATEDDPRVTRVGRLLRAAHIDELTQFVNVIRGDMSVVGPRPERPAFVHELEQKIPFYRLRHAVRPGMAGWALIKHGYGNSLEDAMVKVQYDLYYVKHQSLYLDLYILFRTLQRMVSLKGRPTRGNESGSRRS